MDEGQRTQVSIKEEEVNLVRGSHLQKKGSMEGNTLITHADRKKDPPSGNQGNLNGPRVKSEEPNPIGYDAPGFKYSNPTPFSTGLPLKSGPEHRPVTKSKLF